MLQHLRVMTAKAVVAAGFLMLTGPAAAPARAQNCDRACLNGLITQYVDALLTHDPFKLPLADKVKFTEDSRALKLGEGLWKTVTGKSAFRQDYLDVRRQVAAAHLVFQEDKNQVLLSVLLHARDRKIEGIETLVQRVTPDSRMKPRELGAPIRGMNDTVPAGRKMARAAMVKTALTYTEGLRVGNFIDAGTPFAKETYRVENGVIMAGDGCGREDCGMYTQSLMVHPGIIPSVAAVDEDNGVVLLWMNFGHTGNSYGEGNALVTFAAFKVWGGEIHSILAFFKGLPVGTSRFWPSSDPMPK